MQRALRHEVFEGLAYGVRHLSGRFTAQHFGLHRTGEFGHGPVADANLFPLRRLKQGHGDRLQGLVAEGRHQHAGVDVSPGSHG